MKTWTWNNHTTRAATYAVARRNIQYRAFGRRWCPARDRVDPQEVTKNKQAT